VWKRGTLSPIPNSLSTSPRVLHKTALNSSSGDQMSEWSVDGIASSCPIAVNGVEMEKGSGAIQTAAWGIWNGWDTVPRTCMLCGPVADNICPRRRYGWRHFAIRRCDTIETRPAVTNTSAPARLGPARPGMQCSRHLSVAGLDYVGTSVVPSVYCRTWNIDILLKSSTSVIRVGNIYIPNYIQYAHTHTRAHTPNDNAA